MSRDGLKRVYLIKSAGYEYVEIDLSDNTLLLGESGVGKTTLMRAVLFFYTMDYSDSMLNLTSETKKSFNEWYFKEHNSHIVYNYTKDESSYLFVVSKTSKLHYTFIDISNQDRGVKEIFIDKNKPVNFEKLNETLQKYAIPSYTTTIKERYINIFHKRDDFGKKIKTESGIDFSLFEDIKSRKEFARTLSNIFASSSIKSTNIKKTVVSLIDNSSARIALYDIKTNLNRFATEKKEIEMFEQKRPIIEKLEQEFALYKESKARFKKVANEIEYLHKHSVYKMQNLDLELDEQQKTREQETQKYYAKQELLEEEKSSKKTFIDIHKARLSELIKKEQEFQKKDILKILEEDAKEQSYRDEKVVLEERYKALTSNVEEIESRYKDILQQLEQNAREYKQQQERDLSTTIFKKTETINSIVTQKESKILSATDGFNKEKIELEKMTQKFNEELHALRHKQGQLEHFVFNKEKIDECEENIRAYDKKLLDVELSMGSNAISIKEVQKEIESIKLSLANDMKTLNDEYIKSKESISAKKDAIEKKLDFDSHNLYGYLNKNDVKNKEKIVTYLKDEILFEERAFRVNYSSDENTIFGLNVEFEEEFSNDYKQEELLKELNLIKTELKELNKKSQKEKYLLEDSAAKQTKEKNLQRTILYKEKEDLDATKKAYIKNRDSLKIELDALKKESQKLKAEEIKRVNEQLIGVESSIKNNTQRVSYLQECIKSQTQKINSYVEREIAGLKQEIEELKNLHTLKLKELNAKLIADKDNYELEKLEALQAEGVDKKVLDDLSSQKREIELKLQRIQNYKKDVVLYDEIKDELAKIVQKQEELQQKEQEYEDIKERLKLLQREYKKSDEVVLNAIRILEKQKENLKTFLKRYSQKIENQPIQKSMKKVAILDFRVDIDSVESEAIESLLTIFSSIKKNEAQIKSLVMGVLTDLKIDNIFKLDIPTDFLEDIEYTKTAIELIEYINKDKLTPLKDALSEQFKGEIRKIAKELDIFDDALLDIEYQIRSLGSTIRKAVESFNVVDSIEIKSQETNNNLLHTLKELSDFYDNNSDNFLNGLFEIDAQDSRKVKDELDNKVLELVEILNTSKEYLELEDGFVLEFKIVEKGNNLKWRQNIDDIGSNGTSTLVKSIINISMLQMVSKNIVKTTQLLTHCVLDEIGTISTDYFKELKEFVNRSGFVFLNGMPIEDDMLISMYPTIYVGQNYGSYSKMVLASKMEI